jgi:protein NEDD1
MAKTIASPVQRAGKPTIVSLPASRRLASATTEGSPLTVKPAVAQPKKVLSPAKDPHGNTNDVRALPRESLLNALHRTEILNPGEVAQSRPKKTATSPLNVTRQRSKESLKPHPSPSPRASLRSTGKSQSSSKSTLEPKQLRRSRTLPSSKSVALREEKAPQPIHSASEHLCVPDGIRPRRVTPSASHPGSDSACGSTSALSSTAEQSQNLSTAASRTTSSTCPESSKGPSGVACNRASMAAKPSCAVVSSAYGGSCRTPSPGLSESLAPLTPVFKQQKNNKSTGMRVLGLGTPEVERWINAGKGEDARVKDEENNVKGKSKTVYFKDEGNQDEDAEEVEELMQRARKLSLQISPCRPVPSTSGSTVDSWAGLAANSPSLSAMSHPANASASSPPAVASTAHDLLKTIVQDVMFDFQRETKAEMMGLHLDLLRMGRSWKTELRSLMDEYVGDLREMREENERLRKENERLKRGWQ